jgi:hypothetical protein
MICAECNKEGADRIYKWGTVNVLSFVCRECEALVREQDVIDHAPDTPTDSLPAAG